MDTQRGWAVNTFWSKGNIDPNIQHTEKKWLGGGSSVSESSADSRC